MAAKAGLDKNKAGAVEEKAGKELEEKAQKEKNKEKDDSEVARNPELPAEEKLGAKDVAEVLAPVEVAKKEDKAAEKAEKPGEKEEKGKEEAEKPKEKQEKDAEKTDGVKEVEDPEKAQKEGKKKGKTEAKDMTPKDKLVVDGAQAETEEKREAGDVFFVASLAALAHSDPNMLEKNCRENGDRTFTVTFYEKDPKSETGYKAHEVVVDPDMAPEMDEAEGKSKEDGKTDRLMAIVSQAYTDWRGGEDKVGEGKGGAALEALTGAETEYVHNNESDAEAIWSTLVEACSWNRPCLASTRADETKAAFSEAEVKPWHVYVVLKCKEVNGKRMVTLRNPFGRTGMAEGNVMEFDLEKFVKMYRGVTVGSSIPEKEAKGKKQKKGGKSPADAEKTKKTA